MENDLTIQLFFFGLAVTVALEAYKAIAPARYVLWAGTLLFVLIAFLWVRLSEAIPRLQTAMAEVTTNPTTWFVLAVAIYFVVRPYWKGEVQPIISHTFAPYDDHELQNSIDGVDQKLKDLKDEFNHEVDRIKRHDDALEKAIEHTNERCESLANSITAEAGERADLTKPFADRLDEQRDWIKGLERDIEGHKWSLLAIFHREQLLRLAEKISDLGSVVGLENDSDKQFDAEQFKLSEKKFHYWLSLVGQWSRYASFYMENEPDEVIKRLSAQELHENWGVKSDQFPDDGIVKYKTFRIYLRNWSHLRDTIHEKVHLQAFNRQQTNTRRHYGS